MAGNPPWPMRLATIVALAASLSIPGIGQANPASAVADLKVQRRIATAELEAAKGLRARAWEGLDIARRSYRAAYLELQEMSAAIWMGVAPTGRADAELVELTAAAIGTARRGIQYADIGVTSARQALEAIEARLVIARRDARGRRAAAEERAASRPAKEADPPTIACPVAAASAIYADFGAPRSGGPHRGIDIPASAGTPATAAWYARVLETPHGGWMGKGVILQDGAMNTWWYAHLSRIDVQPGQTVARGQQIGLVGSTGNSTGPHLHFEVHARGVTPVDPYTLASPACGMADPLSPAERVAYESSTDAAN